MNNCISKKYDGYLQPTAFKRRLQETEAEMHVEIASHFQDVPVAFLCRYPQGLKFSMNFIFNILTLSTTF